ADLDQIVAVGAVTVQEHHQSPGLSAAGLDSWAVELSGHGGPHSSWRSWSFACGLSCGLWRAWTGSWAGWRPSRLRGVRPRDSSPTAGALLRSATAAMR